MKIEFKTVTSNDLNIMREWIKQNEFVKKWYYYDKLPRISTLRKKTLERMSIPNFYANIILFDGKPIGYIQSYDIEGWGLWSKRVKIFNKTVGMDYFIGEIDYIHKGYGEKIIMSYIQNKISKKQYDYVMISPDPLNIVNCKCVERCGFKLQKIVSLLHSNSKHKEAIYLKSIC